jgi:hypothetical protein
MEKYKEELIRRHSKAYVSYYTPLPHPAHGGIGTDKPAYGISDD